jgi:SAM-dependent methyltransferase
VITVDFNRLCGSDSNRLASYRILDIGCGTGRHTCAAFRFSKVVAIGIDIKFGDVLEAKNRLKFQKNLEENFGGVLGFSVADMLSLPFKDNFFDLVICSEVLEHIHDHKAAVSETVRVLKPGKDLVVSVPRYLPERICWTLSENYHNVANGHIRIYKKKDLIDLLEKGGLKRWGVHFAHSLHTPYWWLKCIVGPAREDCQLVNLYHNLLVWDMMKKPWITRFLENLLNPVLGKSIVIYLRKEK